MKLFCVGAAAVLLLGGAAAGAQSSGSCGSAVEAPLRSRGVLIVDSRAAGMDVVGTETAVVRVTCTTEDPAVGERVRMRLEGSAEREKLTISGEDVKNGNLKIRVEVPRRTGLEIHMPAGQVTVEKVAGDKDIQIYAGQIVIRAGDPGDYRSVDASVDIGQVKAAAFGVDKGGFFRSFTKKTPGGEYRLRAHVMTGQIDLE